MSDALSDKIALRRLCADARREARLRLGPAAGERLAAAFGQTVIPAGGVVAGFWPIGDEIDTLPLMTALEKAGHVLALPVVIARAQPLVFRRWRVGAPLEAGPHGTRQPGSGADPVEPDVILTPLLGFDGQGSRLGYGGGYYDRTLEELRRHRPVLAVGLAFAAQRVERVPVDVGDQTLDWVVTEEGVERMAR
ncbi:MAG: 5-formyltetrahydrofolate cyclo-ligase [Rhodospirillaceae bacterium]|nr:5-formyltetrahydrofolate cyclo-ligase [Rhodospirillaceae bacterium]